MIDHPDDPNLEMPDSFGGSDYEEQQCRCTECDCDLIAAADGAVCIACANGYCGTVPRCGRTR